MQIYRKLNINDCAIFGFELFCQVQFFLWLTQPQSLPMYLLCVNSN